MSILQNKIDFAVILSVKNANPNGDPLNGNRPRETYNGIGEISDVCIKRKIRNRLMDMGYPVFVQSDDRCQDGLKSLRERADACEALKGIKDRDSFSRIACEQWMDVRSFGQLFAFSKDKESSGVSMGIRGPVSVHPAFSVSPIDIVDIQITKSVNGDSSGKDADKKSKDTMGMKHRVPFGVYVFYGSINCQLAEKTGFTEEDADVIHTALESLFENDCSSARPDGSMEIRKVYWWKHNCKSGQLSSAKVHRSLHVEKKEGVDIPEKFEDYVFTLDKLDGLEPVVSDGV